MESRSRAARCVVTNEPAVSDAGRDYNQKGSIVMVASHLVLAVEKL